MTIISLTLATPILDLYGPNACDLYYGFLIAHNTLVATGGFFMAHTLCPISKLHSIPGKIDGQIALVAIH